jgi:hypothetical protein
VEPFPDLSKLSLEELRELIHDFERQENEISYQRRLLHGKIGLLKAELVARLQKQEGEGGLSVDLEKLSAILAGKGPSINEPGGEDDGPAAAA